MVRRSAGGTPRHERVACIVRLQRFSPALGVSRRRRLRASFTLSRHLAQYQRSTGVVAAGRVGALALGRCIRDQQHGQRVPHQGAGPRQHQPRDCDQQQLDQRVLAPARTPWPTDSSSWAPRSSTAAVSIASSGRARPRRLFGLTGVSGVPGRGYVVARIDVRAGGCHPVGTPRRVAGRWLASPSRAVDR